MRGEQRLSTYRWSSAIGMLWEAVVRDGSEKVQLALCQEERRRWKQGEFDGDM